MTNVINTRKLMHVFTAVLFTAMIAFSMSGSAMDHAHKSGDDIVDVAVANGNFKTLAAALQAAGLVDVLKGEGPFTVFAPTDEAFAKLPAGTVEDLLKPKNLEKLKAVLTYHVVAGKVAAADVVKLSNATTVNGADVNITVNDGNVGINDSTVVMADVMASNGIIHVVDTVLLPPASKASLFDDSVSPIETIFGRRRTVTTSSF